MCSRDYREEHPCDLPFVHDRDNGGTCDNDLLAEDYIASFGPSRYVFTAYALTISVICTGIMIYRFWNLWLKSRHRRFGAEGFRQFMQKPTSQMHAVACWLGLMLTIYCIDIRAYGGRINYHVSYMLQAQILASGILIFVYLFNAWEDAMEMSISKSRHYRRVSTIGALVSLTVANVILPPVSGAPALIPDDAADGVFNGTVSSVQTLINVTVLIVQCTMLTLTYFRISRQLQQFEHAVIGSRSVESHVSQVKGARSDDSIKEQEIQRAGHNSTLSQGSMKQQLRKKGLALFATLSGSNLGRDPEELASIRRRQRSLKGVFKYLLSTWIFVTIGTGYSIYYAAINIPACYTWEKVPRYQWGDIIVCIELFGYVLFVYTNTRVKRNGKEGGLPSAASSKSGFRGQVLPKGASRDRSAFRTSTNTDTSHTSSAKKATHPTLRDTKDGDYSFEGVNAAQGDERLRPSNKSSKSSKSGKGAPDAAPEAAGGSVSAALAASSVSDTAAV